MSDQLPYTSEEVLSLVKLMCHEEIENQQLAEKIIEGRGLPTELELFMRIESKVLRKQSLSVRYGLVENLPYLREWNFNPLLKHYNLPLPETLQSLSRFSNLRTLAITQSYNFV